MMIAVPVMANAIKARASKRRSVINAPLAATARTRLCWTGDGCCDGDRRAGEGKDKESDLYQLLEHRGFLGLQPLRIR
jgi:hypothetical protein